MKSLAEFINECFICESYINLFTKEEMKKYSKEVWDMVEKAYAYIGGVAGCPDYEAFVQEYVERAKEDQLMWKVFRRNNKISAIKIYTRKRGGRKSIVSATDGTAQGKKDGMKILQDDFRLKDRNMWAEVSGKALGAALKNGACVLPNYTIETLMQDKAKKGQIKLLDDGWFYLRQIGGEWHAKVVIGNPPESQPIQITAEEQAQIKELGKKYEREYSVKHKTDEQDSKDLK